MKRPPRKKYRNLHPYRGTLWYERVANGRRYRENTEEPATQEGWDNAARWRDAYEAQRGIGSRKTFTGAMPTFEEMAERYLDEDTHHLATTTREDRRLHLAQEGAVIPRLGAKRLDDLTSALLREWWNLEIETTSRTASTGRHYLASIAAVFSYAQELGYIHESPVDAFRRGLSRRDRTKRGRASSTSKANPIEDREEVARLVAAAQAEGPMEYVLVLTMLDAGLRRGESVALRWRSIAWGVSDGDPRRHVLVSRSRSRDAEEDAPKSGRARRVQLSRRLRGALEELFQVNRPGSLDERLCGDLDGIQFLKGPWARIASRAGLPGRVPKDLRDTFGSWLVSCGIPLLYVSKQLGHSSVAVTENHYARWIPGGGDLYVQPPALEPGDVPADLLTRLPKSPQNPHIGDPYALPDSLKSLDLH